MDGKESFEAAMERLQNAENQARIAGDVAKMRKSVTNILKLCYNAKDWNALNDQILMLPEKPGQLKEVVLAMTNKAWKYLSDIPDKKTRKKLVKSVNTVFKVANATEQYVDQTPDDKTRKELLQSLDTVKKTVIAMEQYVDQTPDKKTRKKLLKSIDTVRKTVSTMEEQVVQYFDQRLDDETRIKLLQTRNDVSAGKFPAELEGSRSVKTSAEIEEQPGLVAEAADLMEVDAVETSCPTVVLTTPKEAAADTDTTKMTATATTASAAEGKEDLNPPPSPPKMLPKPINLKEAKAAVVKAGQAGDVNGMKEASLNFLHHRFKVDKPDNLLNAVKYLVKNRYQHVENGPEIVKAALDYVEQFDSSHHVKLLSSFLEAIQSIKSLRSERINLIERLLVIKKQLRDKKSVASLTSSLDSDRGDHFIVIDVEPSQTDPVYAMEVALVTASFRSFEPIEEPKTFLFYDPSSKDELTNRMKKVVDFDKKKIKIEKGCPALLVIKEAFERGSIVLGYNIGNDEMWIRGLYQRAGMDLPTFDYYEDAYPLIYKQFRKHPYAPKGRTLQDLYTFCELGRQEHRALSDAMGILKVMKCIGANLLRDFYFLDVDLKSKKKKSIN